MLGFSQVDVFTDQLTAGNPVAVVHAADELTTAQMQAFARWTNLSETTFLLLPHDPAADYRLRIFTPSRELPFAGHPTLGSARAWLRAGGMEGTARDVVQECAVGLIRIRADGQRLAFAAPPVVRGGNVDPEDLSHLASAVGLEPGRIVDAQWTDNGPGWVALLLEDAQTVLELEPDTSGFAPFTSVGVVGPYPEGSDVRFEIRAFVPGMGLGEDPVTGSLNAGVAEWLIGSGRAPDSYVASQGSRLHRRGRIHVDRLGSDIWIGGDTVIGIEGQVAL